MPSFGVLGNENTGIKWTNLLGKKRELVGNKISVRVHGHKYTVNTWLYDVK